MARIVVLGAGVMGSAFCLAPVDTGQEVRLVGTHLDRGIIDSIASGRRHHRLGIALPAPIRPYHHDRLAEALADGADLIVLGVNSAGVGWAVEQLAEVLTAPLPILMLTKGLAAEGGTLRILPEVVGDGLAARGLGEVPVAAVGGPCIAGELAVRRESGVVLAHPDPALLDRLLAWVAAPYYHARPSTDLVGVETCAAFKNLYALVIGAAAGLLDRAGPAENAAQMHNPAASLFAQAIVEMRLLNAWMGGLDESVFGMPGTGDLYVTCQGGRNSRVGRLLGAGRRYREAKAEHMPDDTIEGAELALAIGPAVEGLIADSALDGDALPLLRAVIAAICHDAPLALPWPAFHRPGG